MENVKLIKAGSTLAEVFPLGTILSVSAAQAIELISTGACERGRVVLDLSNTAI